MFTKMLDLIFNQKDVLKRFFFKNTIRLQELEKDKINIEKSIIQDSKSNSLNFDINYDQLISDFKVELLELEIKSLKEKYIFKGILLSSFVLIIYTLYIVIIK